jgi:ribosomal protein L12E/L44/L45/RPP1/RPP2
MWDRAHGVTAVVVVVAAMAMSATINNHYTVPAELRALESETRRMRGSIADLTAKAIPYHEVETAALQRLAVVDHEVARAEADSLLLQAKLLEIIANTGHDEQATVPPKIKDMLSTVDTLAIDSLWLQLVHELEAANGREPLTQANSSAAAAAAAVAAAAAASSPEAVAALAKARARSDGARLLDELVAEVVAWRSSPGKAAGDMAAVADVTAGGGGGRGGGGATLKENRRLAALRNALNAERANLMVDLKASRISSIIALRAQIELPIPANRIDNAANTPTDHSGRHWLTVVTESARTSTKLSHYLSNERYGAPSQIETGNSCNQDFGPGLVDVWRQQVQEWCSPHAPTEGWAAVVNMIPEAKDKPLALNTSISCRHYRQRDHSGADQLCVIQEGVLNIGMLSDADATGKVLAKYVSSKHVDDAFMPWQPGTLRGTCKVDHGKWKPENFPMWNKDFLMSYQQVQPPRPPPPPTPSPPTPTPPPPLAAASLGSAGSAGFAMSSTPPPSTRRLLTSQKEDRGLIDPGMTGAPGFVVAGTAGGSRRRVLADGGGGVRGKSESVGDDIVDRLDLVGSRGGEDGREEGAGGGAEEYVTFGGELDTEGESGSGMDGRGGGVGGGGGRGLLEEKDAWWKGLECQVREPYTGIVPY